MANHDHRLAQTFGSRGAYVVLTYDLEHAGTSQAGNDARVGKSQRESGQPDRADAAVPPRPADLEVERALREVVEPDAENQDEKGRDHEVRHAVTDHRRRAQHVVHPGVLSDRSDHAEGHPDADGKDQSHEPDLGADRHLTQHDRGDGNAAVDERLAQIAMDHAGKEVDVLDPQRPVKPVVMECLLVLITVQVLAEQGVAWEAVDAQKHQRGDTQHGEHDQHQALPDIDQRSAGEQLPRLPVNDSRLLREEGARPSERPRRIAG